jgi:glycosyltransferase involved in cell wall biosynthesis
MNIGFDAKRAFNNYTGLGNYSRSTIQLLEKHQAENNYYLYSPTINEENIPDDFLNDLDVKLRNPNTPMGKIFKGIWRSYGGINTHIKNDEIDVFHGLSNELPVGIKSSARKSVVTIHDLIFMRHPNFYPQIDRIIYKNKFQYACNTANKVICVSEQTAKDVQSFFDISRDKIEVVYQSCNPQFKVKVKAEKLKEAKEIHNLPDEYLLYVGTIEERKNLFVIIEAMQKLGRKCPPLVVVGKKKPYFNFILNFIKRHKMTEKVIFLQDVFYDQLPAIYQQASILIYPSKFEGFGIPMIEALYSGIPAIGATGSCLEEAGGPSSAYITPEDSDQLTELIPEILSNQNLRDEMITGGYLHLINFEEKKIAQDLQNVYNELR